ncbi:MAG: response regulator [Desulfuromonadaceae bacterium]|nr:response regulator [Desulfuromonadaceae bacterium]
MKEFQYAEFAKPAVQLMAIEVISGLLATSSPQELGQSLTEQLRELTGARTVMILLHIDTSGKHELLAVSPLRRNRLFSNSELEVFCPKCSPDDLPYYPKDLPTDHPLSEPIRKAAVKSIARYQLQAGGELVGSLILLDIPDIDRIAEVNQIITPLSPMIALAMRNALAYRQIEQQARELEQRVAERTDELREKNCELSKSEERLDQLAEHSRTISWEVDAQGLYTYLSHVSEAVIGYHPDEIVFKKHFYDIHPDEGREPFKKAAFEVFERKDVFQNLVNPIQTKDGSVVWVSTNGFPMLNADGTLRGYRGSDADITERIRAEEEKQALEQQFNQTQKLESLGVLAGGIAHDFNNILAVIIGYCYMVKMDYEAARDHIPEIEKAADRAAALCRQMLDYAGKTQMVMSPINLWMLVGEMINMLQSTLPQNAVIRTDLSTDIPCINCDSSQIRQIVMNLIINASEAIGEAQGEIRVSLAKTAIVAGQSEKDYNGQPILPGSYLCLEVTDNGCGMDEETKWRIFEPFFTTKFTGRGLGMSAVLGIVKSHGGALQLFSQPGQGTTFKVYLPVQKSDIAEESPEQVSSAVWKGNGTILLVEDEQQVALVAKTMLEAMGFTAIAAENGKEALELYQKHAADIALVLTDLGMPLMDGYTLFHELKKIKPELPIIISSGFGDTSVTSRIAREGIAGLATKPYSFDQLREVLKSVVEGAPK